MIEQKTKRVAILQSNYVPWKGYFDLIRSVDEFILFDEMQYTRRDWRNRNRIKTKDGVKWITIPVQVKGKYFQKISETLVSNREWAAEHWTMIRHSYARAPHFKECEAWLADLYRQAESIERLTDVNRLFLRAFCERFGITTPITDCAGYELVDGKTERLVSLCKQAGATTYISGPAARDYMDDEQWTQAGIALEYMNYSGYPEYDQLYPPFDHYVSMIDALVTLGDDALSAIERKRG